jgi:N-acetylmuramoyl-L-alanine amidase
VRNRRDAGPGLSGGARFRRLRRFGACAFAAFSASGLAAGCGEAGGTPAARSSPAAAEAAAVSTLSTSQTTAPAHTAPALPLAGSTITVDPGHNGGNFTHPQQIARPVPDGNGYKECDTTGTAAPDGYRETDFNWSVAERLKALLQAAGARVVMTRSSNTGVGPCVDERAAIGNRAHSDAAISIHADGGPPDGSGFAILIPAPIPGGGDRAIIAPSRRLGVDLRSALLGIGLHTSTYDGVDGLAPRTDLGGLNLSRVPKVFVEVANMQNKADEAPMERPGYRQRVAEALLRGLESFLARR